MTFHGHPIYLSFALQSGLVAAGLFGFGYLLADALAARRPLDRLERAALAVPALVLWAFVLMALHLLTRGRVFSEPWVVRLLTGGAAALLIRRKVRRRERTAAADRPALVAAGALVLLGIVVWGNPALRLLPLAHTADTNWHMGWASQLMNGQPTPTAPIPGAIPNYYPWMFHAFVAFVTWFTPGGRAFLALDPIQYLQVSGSVLALFALGRLVGRTWLAGAAASLLGALSGGIGFLALRRLDVVADPRAPDALRYWGDLFFLRSYNPSFQNLAPPFPRDVALTLLVAAVFLLGLGLARRVRGALVGAGLLIGLIGLTGGEAFFVALGAAALLALLPGTLRRAEVALCVFAPAFALYAFWLVPVLASYRRLGGFVNTTVIPPVSLPAWAILASWGVFTPLAVWGGLRYLPRTRTDPAARALLALLAAAGGILAGSSLIPGVLGRGFSVLGRAHRYWPLLGLAVATFGGLGLADLLRRAHRVRRPLAVALAVVIALFALPSPVVASLAFPRTLGATPELTQALQGGRNDLTVLVAEGGRNRCIIAVARNKSFPVFAYSGYRSVAVQVGDILSHPGNVARIRWRSIYRSAARPDYERLADNMILTGGGADAATWRKIAAKYAVNLALIKAPQTVGSASFAGLPAVRVGRFVIYFVRACS